LNCSAKDGYRSYLQAYASHKQRELFDVNQLDLQKIANSFGLAVPPRVNLNVKVQGRTVRKNKLKEQLGKRGKPQFVRKSQGGSEGGKQFSY
jgi:ATP-dependent RNA helicase DDX18/HAS1